MNLVYLSGLEGGDRYRIEHRISFGRDQSNDIVIADPIVSLVHCEIAVDEGRAFLKDLGSTNGTTVNGERIIATELRDGDEMTVGTNKFRVEIPQGHGKTAAATVMEKPPPAAMPAPVRRVRPRERRRASRTLSADICGQVAYFLKRKIADGGMGSVYEAEQLGAEGFIKKVAIKTILPSFAKKSTFVSSFIGEAKLVANLVHQNIVQIHHLGRRGKGYFIAMEYIDGVNLTDFISRHRRVGLTVPFQITSFIVSRICRGLQYAHSKTDERGQPLNLVHRDVCPNNIMITREGEVKLTDFGVAKATRFMEDDSEYLVGSVEYMSPEQADCRKIDARSDIFSLGLVFFELLTGIRVFQCRDDNIEETAERVKVAKIPDPLEYTPDLPNGLRRILMRSLAKDPEDRYRSAEEMSYALESDLYSAGYGPTILTLAKYMDEINEE